MILQTEGQIVENNFEGKEIDFALDSNSPVLFQLLRKSLYSDPIRAVVVECSSNAVDANRESGCPDTPIKLYLPGEYFCVSDNGPGISPERMENIVCKYGKSTKTHDNSMRGAYGIGFKSPFAIATSFSVETVYDGIKYTYALYLDETDLGKIKLMSQTPTKHERGTIIKVPIRPEDRWRVKDAALKYTQFWKIRPIFPGIITPEYNAPTLEGKRWAIYARSTDGFNILSDSVPYCDTRFNIPPKVVLKFETGQVCLAANREALLYNDYTNNAIKNALKEYDSEVVQLVKTKLDTLTSFSEVLNVIQALPKAYEQRTWEWQGNSFAYPLQNPVTVYERSRSRLNSYHSKILDENVTENSWILLDKTDLTSYDRTRISSFLKQHGLKRIYLLEKTHTLPVKAIALSTIKVLRAKSTSGPRAKRAAKTTVKGRRYNHRIMSDFLIDTPTPIVYTTLSISNHGYQYRNFPVSVIQIAERDVKHVVNQPKWFTLDEYINEEIYTKLSAEQIQKEADRQDFISKYNDFSFLVDDDDFKFFKNTTKDSVVTDTRERLIYYLVRQGKISVVSRDIFAKYPLLNSLRYVPCDQRKHVIEYVKLVKLNQTLNQTQLIGAKDHVNRKAS